ncbi:hypothetical protein GCM10009527_014300 [Actinomadura nitritigenes]|uniref:Uncharacterized protein n=1 Tax=Actinomadura nitritigenes TaxID=134602 RepID=A0ABS3RG83_9ACTN|nr:hypothetical protein [Actinomadura nitritigenes]MBO2445245.1 hypothetical protein [Actinomadura nitritigenes]
MELSVATSEDHAADLYAWLSEDRAVTRGATFSPPVPIDEGTLGGGFEWLNFAVSSGFSLAGLITSLASYRLARRQSTGQAPDVTIHCQTIVITVGDDVQETLRRVDEALGDLAGPGE